MERCRLIFAYLCLLPFIAGCDNAPTDKIPGADSSGQKGTYGYDASFLKKHGGKMIELASRDGDAKVILSPAYQGRVMTSTATGDSGTSFGWINYDLLSSGEKKKQFNPVGGEERFWMGPEGGQYSIYFRGGDSFNLAHWQVPAFIDTEPFDLGRSDSNHAVFLKKASFTNYSGTSFNIIIERTITLLDKKALAARLHYPVPENLNAVGYETLNRVQNTGAADWTKKTGLLSIWLLGMFTPSPRTIVMVPFEPQKNARDYITDNYFGTIPPERLQVRDSVAILSCDGSFRSKIGLSPKVARPLAGSFDFGKNILTIISFELNKTAPYVNSKWEIQAQPYEGDVVNAYNDGPLADGNQLGPFYELESSSPALELKKGEAGLYRQSTCHFQGDYETLRRMALQLIGADLNDFKK